MREISPIQNRWHIRNLCIALNWYQPRCLENRTRTVEIFFYYVAFCFVLFCLGLNVGGFYMVEFIRMPISKLEGHCCERNRE